MSITPSSSKDQVEAPPHGHIRGELVVKDSAVIAAFTGFGAVAALLMDAMVAFKYGMGASTDALFIALTIPQLLSSVLGTTIMPVMVPLFSRTRAEIGEEHNWIVFSNLANLTLVLLTGVALVGAACSPLLMLASAPGLDPATRQLAVKLNQVLFLTVALVGAADMCKAMLNSQRRFAVPAAANTVQYLVAILTIALLGHRFGIQAAAVGYVLGCALRLLMQAIALIALGGRYRPVLNVKDPTVRQVGKLMIPLFLAQLQGQAGIWAERFLASFLPTGSISALVYARRTLRALNLAFVNSVSSALLPRLSVLVTRRNLDELRRSVLLGIRVTLGVCTPLAVGVMALSVPLVSLLFRRGAFDEAAVATCASILVFYMPSLPFMALLQLAMSPHYAFQDTKTPLLIKTASLVLLVLLQLILSRVLGVAGLAAALSLSSAATAIGAFVVLRRRIGYFEGNVWRFSAKVGTAALVMALVILPVIGWIASGVQISARLQEILQLVSAGVIGAAVYSGGLVLLRVDGVREGIALVRRRIVASAR
jgi:putative peptidoglycan lipid II flippase